SRLCSSVAGLSPAVEDGVEAIAIPGTAEPRIGAGDRSTATAPCGSSGTIGRGPGSGGGIGPTHHRRNRSQGGGFPLAEGSVLLVGSLPGGGSHRRGDAQ